MKDSWGRPVNYLRLSVTDRCNLGCRYCMPPEGIELAPRDQLLSFEEILRLTSLLVRLGVQKVRLTGGEPTLRHDLPGLAARLKRIPGLKRLLLTTNGVTLAPLLSPLREAGVDGVTLSLDTLSREKFHYITRHDQFEAVRASLRAALDCRGLRWVKLNMVVVRSLNLDEVAGFARLARDEELEVRFVEYMPFARNEWRSEDYVPESEIRRTLGLDLKPLALDDPLAGPARLFTFPGARGGIGFISALSHSFCGRCNRLRLSSQGRLTLCLHDEAGIDLRGPLRGGATDEELSVLIRRAVLAKPRRGGLDGAALYSGIDSPAAIGG